MMDMEQNQRQELQVGLYEQEELKRSREQIRQLQDNIYSLRMSRRVLMSLLEQVQTSQQEEISRLKRQNAQLQKQNQGYAGRLWQQNRRIHELEQGPGL